MKSEYFKKVLTDSKQRARFFSSYCAIFAGIYHFACILLFSHFNVLPLVYYNFFSICFYAFLFYISPKLKRYVIVYLFSCLEVYCHQTLGILCIGLTAGFHYFFIPFALLPLYTFRHRIKLASLFTIIGGLAFIITEGYGANLPTLYVIPNKVIMVLRLVNIFLTIVLSLSSIIFYAYIVSYSENNLEQQVEEKAAEVRKKDKALINLQNHTVISLANLVESRDSNTGEHIQRISNYVALIANAAFTRGLYPETITPTFIKNLKRAAPMHDIGKIVITDAILKKPATLSSDEFSIIQTHTTEGSKIVKDIIGISDNKDYIDMAEEVALSHHERWDGTGYPKNLKGDEIPISARILAIADVFDALVSERCYKKAYSVEDAFKIIQEESGSHFDPELVRVFLEMKEQIADNF